MTRRALVGRIAGAAAFAYSRAAGAAQTVVKIGIINSRDEMRKGMAADGRGEDTADPYQCWTRGDQAKTGRRYVANKFIPSRCALHLSAIGRCK